MAAFLVELDDERALDPAVVGFKFASLAAAVRAGFPVPPAVAVTTAAHRAFLTGGGVPPGLDDELRRAAGELDSGSGLSVRSSATLEDLSEKSFAGLYKTFLNVKGEQELLRSLVACWKSADSEVVKSYLRQSGLDLDTPLMGVVVQRMVDAAAAGVAFSRNPIRPGREEVVIEAVPGLADRLVAGHVTPYRFFFRPGNEADGAAAPAGGEGELGRLDRRLWQQVADLARRAETELGAGRPQDIEWAADPEGRVWLLQARPITTLAVEELRAPDGTWTRGIAVDLWADRLSPFLGDAFIRKAERYDFSAISRAAGIAVVQPILAIINGYLYVNCASLERVLAVLPPRLRIEDLRAYFPPGFALDEIPPPSAGKLLAVGLRSLLLGLRVPRANPLWCARLSRRGLELLAAELAEVEAAPAATAAAALAQVRAAAECLARLQERNQWPYFYAAVFTTALRWSVVEWAGLAHADFLRLISGRTDNVTSEIEREFRRLSERIAADPALKERFLAEPAEGLAGSLPAPVADEVAAFLARYGCRARHRALYVRRWAEAPEEVVGMLQTLVRREAPPEEAAEPAAPTLPRGLPPLRRLVLRPLHRYARRYLDLREDLRFFLDRILFAIRRSLLDLGRLTGLGDDVFFLTEAELAEVVAGDLALGAAQAKAAGRRRSYEAESEPHSFYVDGRPVEDLPAGATVLRGVGTSGGRFSGPARIVDDPTRAEIRHGDVLVARNTDPGWTPVLSAVGGVVVEEGSLLNHCSIVARELRIPAVVGVRQATRRIQEGARITVDGDLGIVHIADGP